MLKSNTYIGSGGRSSTHDEVVTFLASGHETTATSMIRVMHSLSQPESRHIQSCFRAGIYPIFSSNLKTTITYDQIPGLKYLSHITSGALPLYPLVGVMLRMASEDIGLNGAFMLVRMLAVLSSFAINRCVVLWGADAEAFRLRRWAGGQD